MTKENDTGNVFHDSNYSYPFVEDEIDEVDVNDQPTASETYSKHEYTIPSSESNCVTNPETDSTFNTEADSTFNTETDSFCNTETDSTFTSDDVSAEDLWSGAQDLYTANNLEQDGREGSAGKRKTSARHTRRSKSKSYIHGGTIFGDPEWQAVEEWNIWRQIATNDRIRLADSRKRMLVLELELESCQADNAYYRGRNQMLHNNNTQLFKLFAKYHELYIHSTILEQAKPNAIPRIQAEIVSLNSNLSTYSLLNEGRHVPRIEITPQNVSSLESPKCHDDTHSDSSSQDEQTKAQTFANQSSAQYRLQLDGNHGTREDANPKNAASSIREEATRTNVNPGTEQTTMQTNVIPGSGKTNTKIDINTGIAEEATQKDVDANSGQGASQRNNNPTMDKEAWLLDRNDVGALISDQEQRAPLSLDTYNPTQISEKRRGKQRETLDPYRVESIEIEPLTKDQQRFPEAVHQRWEEEPHQPQYPVS